MKDYLLGRLSPEDRETVAEQIFANDDEWAAAEAVECDLVDRYTRGELPPEEARAVQENLLRPRVGRGRQMFAQGMVGRERRRRDSTRAWLAAAAALALVLGAGLLRLAMRPDGPSVAPLTTFTIPLSTIRGEAAVPQVRVPASRGTLRVVVPLQEASTPPYRLTIDGPAGFHLEASGEVAGANAAFPVNATSLPTGRCDIKVYGGNGGLAAAGQVDLVR